MDIILYQSLVIVSPSPNAVQTKKVFLLQMAVSRAVEAAMFELFSFCMHEGNLFNLKWEKLTLGKKQNQNKTPLPTQLESIVPNTRIDPLLCSISIDTPLASP